jgi:hypothetical protein
MPNIYDEVGQTDGKQCSSTYEGRHIDVLGSALSSPGTIAATGLKKGEAVFFGDVGVGISFAEIAQADLATQYATLDTEGIWWKTVTLSGTRGAGQAVYIVEADGTLRDTGGAGTRLFGYLITGGASGARLCAVKVHFGQVIGSVS